MSADRAAISAIVLTAMGDAWSDSAEYSALPGVTADLVLTSDWLAEHDRQVAERAWDEGQKAGLLRADFEYGAIGYQHVKGNPYTRKEQ